MRLIPDLMAISTVALVLTIAACDSSPTAPSAVEEDAAASVTGDPTQCPGNCPMPADSCIHVDGNHVHGTGPHHTGGSHHGT